jgi:hypothetical protein
MALGRKKLKITFPCHVTYVVPYSSTCRGQNKNSPVAVIFLTVTEAAPHIQRVHHKFMISGLSQMECDTPQTHREIRDKTSDTSITPL